ncbi:uncharacterized protein LOC144860112 [Branchiostoma floridae x Branchiostoma japonicum]
MSSTLPETTIVSSTQLQTITVSSTQPETTTVSSTQPETTTVSSTQPETTTVSSSQPETTTVSSTQQETTTVLSTQPETTIVSSTQPETTIISSTQPETTTLSSTQPETTILSSTQPETTTVSSTQLQTTTVSSTQPETTTLSSTQPETTTVSSSQPETTTVSSTQLETTTVSSTQPETTTLSSTQLETTTLSSTQPETTTVSSSQPETTTVSSTQLQTTTMSSTQPETTTVSSKQPETTAVSSIQPETTTVSSTQPETTTVSSIQPETTTMSSTRPETTIVSSTRPETTTVSSTQPETTTVSSTQPETTTVSSTQPETTSVSSTQPETTTVPSTQPETTTVSSTQPETTTVSYTQPETTILSSRQPETTTVSSTQPETTTVSSIQPETTTLSSTRPETTILSSTRPETTIVSSTQPETTTVSSSQPETTTVSSIQPETTTVSSTQPETTTVSSTQLETTTVSSTQPETTTVSTTMSSTQPETTVSSSQPETTTVSSTQLQTTTVSSTQPETTTVSSTQPETTTVSSTQPETTTVSSTQPETTTVSSTQPETTTVSSTQPETTTVSSTQPETTTLSSTQPETTTVSSTQPETTTSTPAGFVTSTTTETAAKSSAKHTTDVGGVTTMSTPGISTTTGQLSRTTTRSGTSQETTTKQTTEQTSPSSTFSITITDAPSTVASSRQQESTLIDTTNISTEMQETTTTQHFTSLQSSIATSLVSTSETSRQTTPQSFLTTDLPPATTTQTTTPAQSSVAGLTSTTSVPLTTSQRPYYTTSKTPSVISTTDKKSTVKGLPTSTLTTTLAQSSVAGLTSTTSVPLTTSQRPYYTTSKTSSIISTTDKKSTVEGLPTSTLTEATSRRSFSASKQRSTVRKSTAATTEASTLFTTTFPPKTTDKSASTTLGKSTQSTLEDETSTHQTTVTSGKTTYRSTTNLDAPQETTVFLETSTAVPATEITSTIDVSTSTIATTITTPATTMPTSTSPSKLETTEKTSTDNKRSTTSPTSMTTPTTLACIDGQYGAWSEWSNCSAYCGLGFQSRTRQCNNPPPSICGRYCIGQDTEIKNCQNKECVEGHINWCSDEEDRCGQVSHGGICSLLEDDYLCSCQPGWSIHRSTNGTFLHCHDIEECESGRHDCDPVAICTNTLGGYTCECPSGYIGNGTYCRDVDECATSDATNCDDNAYCQNLAGGFTCVCEYGFKSSVDEGTGFTGQCIEDRFYPFGEDQNDLRLTASSSQRRQSLSRNGHHMVMEEASSSLIGIENGIPLFGGIICNSVYVSENGLLVITSTRAEEQEYINEYLTFRHPESMDTVLESNRTNVCGVLAAFWSNNRFRGLQTNQAPKIWYQAYTNTSGDILQRSSQDVTRYFPGTADYRATFTLVATWEDMVPDWETGDGETNTFQAVLTTDNVNTFVWYVYKDGGMTWVPNYLPDVIQFDGYPARVGYAVRNSYTSEEDHNSAQWAWVSSEENVYRIDQKVSMTTNMTGRIAYRLENNGPEFVNPVKACRDWHNEEPDPTSWASEVMHTCPGYLSQAREEIGLWEVTSSDNGHVCFQRRFALSSGGNLDCCYKKEDQGLISSLHMWDKGTGFVHRYEKSTNQTSPYYRRDYLPRMWCCHRSRSDKCCELYAEKRPPASFRNYIASFLATAYGEPHIRTLDGRTYTFNGHGEYVMLRSTSAAPHAFMMQGRTDRPVMDGVRIRATVFTAIAVQQPNNKVQVYLDSNGTGVEVTIDDENIPLAAIADGSQTKFDDGLITVIYDAGKSSICGVVISYPSGISASIKAQAGLLTFVLGLGADMRGNLQGLLGNLNGDPDDDFILPNGSYVHAAKPDNPTEKELYYNFGKMWSLRSVCLCDHTDVNNDTLFHNYPDDPSDNSPENYGDDDFVPKFFDDVDLFPNEETRKMAISTCGAENRECIYDIALTSQVDIGLGTTQSETEYRTSNEILRNSAPEVFAPTEIRAFVNKTYTTSVRGMDACPYVDIAVSGVGKMTKTGNYSADFSWTPTSAAFVVVEFTVTDDMGASSISVPDVTVCACENGGICDFDGVTDRVEGFALAVCVCPTGFSGATCQTDVDACEGNPCFQGVECTDQPAPLAPGQPGYTCGACPFEMVGNGESCADLNECMLDASDPRAHRCVNADCVNTPGSYSCVCHAGFAKEGDSHTCTDIDECRSLNTNDCDPLHGICTNTPGSYNCSCQTGCYTTDNGRTCQDLNECMTENGGCERLCVNTKGSYYCQCGVAYVLTEDGHSCEELDECAAEHVCEQMCVDKVGYYDCSCGDLFTLNLDGTTCEPIINCSTNNPCAPPPIGHCAINMTTSGDQEEVCGCAAGYQILAYNTCADINECENGHKCDEHGDCVNTEGSYECSCHPGYKLDKDHGKRHCRNIDECAIDNGNCTHLCVDTPGSFYCTCPQGMVLDKDMCTCLDVDECTENLARCSVNAYCNNTSPGYDCICNTGYSGDGIMCGDINECLYQDTHNVRCKVGCLNTIGSFVCTCSIGWQLANDSISCIDMDECLLGVDRCNHNCHNTPGSYTCSCRQGYLLGPDGHTCLSLSSTLTTTTPSVAISRQPIVPLPPSTTSSDKPSTTTTQTSPKTTESSSQPHPTTLTTACPEGCGTGGRCQFVNGTSACVCDEGFQLSNGTCVAAYIPDKTKVLLPAVALSIGIPLLCLLCACLAAYRRKLKKVKYYTVDGASTTSGGRWIWLPKWEQASSSGYITWSQNTPNSGSTNSIYKSSDFPWTYSTPNQSSQNSDKNSNDFPWTYSTPDQSSKSSDMNSNEFAWTFWKTDRERNSNAFPWTFWKTSQSSKNSAKDSNDFPWTYSKPNQNSNSSDSKSNDYPWTYSKPNNSSSDNSDRYSKRNSSSSNSDSNDSPWTDSKPDCNSTSSDTQDHDLPGLNRYLPYPNSYRSLRSLSSGSLTRRSMSSRLTGTLSNMSSMTSLGSFYRYDSPGSPACEPAACPKEEDPEALKEHDNIFGSDTKFSIQRPKFIDPSAFKED